MEKEEGDAGPVCALAGPGLALPVVGRDGEGHSEMRPRSNANGNGQQASQFNKTARRLQKGEEVFQEEVDDDRRCASRHGPFVVEEREALLA